MLKRKNINSSMVTLKDIAQRVGKSVTTVSRALNDYSDVSPETKEIVRLAAEEMGYIPNTIAQRLQKQRTDTIGLVVSTTGSRLADPLISELLAGIGDLAGEMGYDLLLSTQSDTDYGLSSYRKMVLGRKVDGFILMRTRQEDPRVTYLTEKNFPFVSFGRVRDNNDFAYVDEDGALGMEQIAIHLTGLGHSKISTIMGDPEYNFVGERLHGLKRGLMKQGLTLPEKYVRIGNMQKQGGYEKALELLNMDDPPTAIIACNDMMALGAMNAAQEMGVIVGEDIAITGFDDITLSENANPPLTTVHQPIYEIGLTISEMLIRIIKGEKLNKRHIVLKPKLIIRQSCGSRNQ